MGNITEEEIIKRLYDLENKELFIILMNYFSNVKDMKKDMVHALDVLDELVENPNKKNKNKLRKIILDNFNDIDRKTKKLYGKLSKILKEE